MKKATNHEFLIKLMDEYRYFTKNKKYKYDYNDGNDDNDDNSNIKEEKGDSSFDAFDEYRRKKRHDYLKHKYNANIHLNKSDYYHNKSHNTS